MRSLRRLCALVTLATAGAVGSPCHATFHRWDVAEVYSNHDGSVQFIEFFTTFASQHLVNNHTITATSTVGGTDTVKTFTFPNNLSLSPPNPSSTANKRMLIATPGFGALAGGVTPDFDLNYLPTGGPFFNPHADSITINFVGADAPLTFAGSLLPKDGVNALRDDLPNGTPQLVSVANTPTNFQGQTGAVNLPPPTFAAADFNEDTFVDGDDLADWELGYGATGVAATKAAGNADADEDVDGADFLIWQRQVGGGGQAEVVPEPASLALLLAAALLQILTVRRSVHSLLPSHECSSSHSALHE